MREGGPIHIACWSRPQLVRLLAATLLGALLGGLGATLALGERLERVLLDNDRLRHELAQTLDDNRRLKESPPERNLTIKAMEVQLEGFGGDERARLRLERDVKALVADHVIGRAWQRVDIPLVRAAVDGRSFVVENQAWRATVTGGYIVWETFVLFVRATPQPVSGSG